MIKEKEEHLNNIILTKDKIIEDLRNENINMKKKLEDLTNKAEEKDKEIQRMKKLYENE